MILLDSDALIHAYRYDFPPDTDPGEFWEWLNNMGSKGEIIVPEKVLKEIKKGNDGLYEFLKSLRDLPIEPEANALAHLGDVLRVYGRLSESDLEIIGKKADPYLVAHGMALGATVVTNEIPRPNATAPLNIKVPDVCSSLGVSCVRYPRFLWNVGK